MVLARSVISRTTALDPDGLARNWFSKTTKLRDRSKSWKEANGQETANGNVAHFVEASRKLCNQVIESGPIWRSYGGHYFSPKQAATIDTMIEALPEREPFRTVCLAATISSGSHCAASPGHTAQPFQPTRGAARFIVEAWARDPLKMAHRALGQICSRRANVAGESVVGEAVAVASSLSSADLVIVDPPYSGVQYSRFYHVLEAIATGNDHSVTGVGRYPPLVDRPQSSFSRPSESKEALVNLLENLSRVMATVIFTFPSGKSSNGLSGETVIEAARRLFDVEKRQIAGRFSTLGGNNTNRSARSDSEELILVMRQKTRS